MRVSAVTSAALGLLVATFPSKAAAQRERFYPAPKDSVWTAILGAFSELKLDADKQNQAKGKLEIEKVSGRSRFACEGKAMRSAPPGNIYLLPVAKLEVWLKEQRDGTTSLRIKLHDMKGVTDNMISISCKSTGALEDSLFNLVEVRLKQGPYEPAN